MYTLSPCVNKLLGFVLLICLFFSQVCRVPVQKLRRVEGKMLFFPYSFYIIIWQSSVRKICLFSYIYLFSSLYNWTWFSSPCLDSLVRLDILFSLHPNSSVCFPLGTDSVFNSVFSPDLTLPVLGAESKGQREMDKKEREVPHCGVKRCRGKEVWLDLRWGDWKCSDSGN